MVCCERIAFLSGPLHFQHLVYFGGALHHCTESSRDHAPICIPDFLQASLQCQRYSMRVVSGRVAFGNISCP